MRESDMQLWIYKVTFKTVRPNVFCLQLAYNTMLLTLCGASGAPCAGTWSATAQVVIR